MRPDRAATHGTDLALTVRYPHSSARCIMAIDWTHDLDARLDAASDSGTPILLDFSAAPM